MVLKQLNLHLWQFGALQERPTQSLHIADVDVVEVLPRLSRSNRIKMRKQSEGDLIKTVGCLGLLTIQVVLTLFMKSIISEERRGRWAEATETARNAQRKAGECILQDSSGFSHNILVERQKGEKEMVKIPRMGHT